MSKKTPSSMKNTKFWIRMRVVTIIKPEIISYRAHAIIGSIWKYLRWLGSGSKLSTFFVSFVLSEKTLTQFKSSVNIIHLVKILAFVATITAKNIITAPIRNERIDFQPIRKLPWLFLRNSCRYNFYWMDNIWISLFCSVSKQKF